MTRGRALRLLLLATLAGATASCASAGEVDRRAGALAGRLDAVEVAAVRCAPRELAAARVALAVARRASALGDGVAAARELDRATGLTDDATAPARLAACAPAVAPPQVTGPAPDGDGDGVADADDRCLTAREDRDGWLDHDGCPDPDNDGDGLGDQVDQCPNEPEDVDGFEDIDGCPEAGGER